MTARHPVVTEIFPDLGNRTSDIETDRTFARTYRLLDANQYKQVFKFGKKRGSRCFTVLVANNQLDHPRLGLAISKKCLKLAVHRNLVKRIIRERFREARSMLPPVDIVFIGRPTLKGTDARVIHKAVLSLIESIK